MDKTSLYYIENAGCDDSTHGLVRLSDEEFIKFKQIIVNLNKNSTYGCMPTIGVYRILDESVIREATDGDDKSDGLYMDDKVYVFAKPWWSITVEETELVI